MLGAILEFLKSLFVFAGYVGDTGRLPESLTKAEEDELIKRLEAGDNEARNILVEHNLRLVAHIAKKYRAPGRDQDDLISIGSIGLIKAVNTYSKSRGKSLASYAGKCVENEILMALRQERKRRGEISIEEPIGTDRDGNEITVGDVIGTDEDAVFGETESKLNGERLRSIVDSTLKGREHTVITLRYGLDGGEPLPQREVAKILRISRSYVSRIETKALAKLRERAAEMGN